MPRKDLLILVSAFLLVCALYFFWSLSVTEPGFPLDDSWIHQVYARNFITGHGFSFTPDHPFSAVTAPLWTLLLAPFWLLLGPVASGIVLGVILEFLALVATYKLAWLLAKDRKIAFFAALLSALSYVLVWGALSGMEIGLYSALSLWGLYFYFKAESFADRRNYMAYFLVTLSFLSRPECAIILAAMIIRDLTIYFRQNDNSFFPWTGRLFLIILLIAPYVVFNYQTAGTPFPKTFDAKVLGRGLISALANGDFKRIAKSFSVNPFSYFLDFNFRMLLFNPLLFLGFYAGIAKLLNFRLANKQAGAMVAIILLLYFPLMGVATPVLTPMRQNMRMVSNLVPMIILVCLIGFFEKSAPSRRTIRMLLVLALLVGAPGIMMITAGDYFVRLLGPYLVQDISRLASSDFKQLSWFVNNFGKNCLLLGLILIAGATIAGRTAQGLLEKTKIRRVIISCIVLFAAVTIVIKAAYYANDVKNINEVDKATALYLHDTMTIGQRAGINDIGAIGYFSGVDLLDLKGLVSPEITTPMILNDSLAFEYMLGHDRVDYLAIFPNWFYYIPGRTDIFKEEKRFAAPWNTILAGDTTIIYRATWPDSMR